MNMGLTSINPPTPPVPHTVMLPTDKINSMRCTICTSFKPRYNIESVTLFFSDVQILFWNCSKLMSRFAFSCARRRLGLFLHESRGKEGRMSMSENTYKKFPMKQTVGILLVVSSCPRSRIQFYPLVSLTRNTKNT